MAADDAIQEAKASASPEGGYAGQEGARATSPTWGGELVTQADASPQGDRPRTSADPTPTEGADLYTQREGQVGPPQGGAPGGGQQPGIRGVFGPQPGYNPDLWQTYADSLQVGQGRQPGALPFRTNALGLRVGETQGHEVNARDLFSLPYQQRQGKVALVESNRGRGTGRDFLEEVEAYRPKGRGARSYFG